MRARLLGALQRAAGSQMSRGLLDRARGPGHIMLRRRDLRQADRRVVPLIDVDRQRRGTRSLEGRRGFGMPAECQVRLPNEAEQVLYRCS